MAPEIIEGLTYDYSVDWWSCGVLAYQRMYGRRPYSDAN
jgi:serine/threonine kinase 32